ncbi:UDP-glucuronosyltransferase 3A1-like isoform X2 [Pollicipes pollicipes]|uniref:UDP-glucuronosyltransferase 3A1-like isoform X2 n=1 Tax=Pollicipes pollicipes TaxID=41117 RepID=UPI0018859095|nr:UDP-glucuronosyltransferase 3A1-like isoform X2 [Pollicipes pollicipes]
MLASDSGRWLLLVIVVVLVPRGTARSHVALVTTDQEAEPLVLQLAQLLAEDHHVTAVLYNSSGVGPTGAVRVVRVPAAASDPASRISWLDRWERYPLLAPDAVVASRVAGCGALRASSLLADFRPDLVISTLYLDDACLLGLLPDAPVIGLLPSPVGLPWVTYQLGGHYPVSRIPVHGYPLGDADFYARLGNGWRWWTLLRRVQRLYQTPVASGAGGHLDLEKAYDRVAAVYVSGDARLPAEVPADRRIRFLGCIECANFAPLPKLMSTIGGGSLLVIRLHHPHVTLPAAFKVALAQGAASSSLTPIDVSNATSADADRVIHSGVPAADALAHSRARVFISECSASSVLLAVHFSVPLVCIPFTAGHKMAAANAVSLGLGVEVDRRSLTPESLRAAITSVTTSAGLRRAVRVRADALRHDAISPAAQFSHDVHHLLMFGGRPRRRRPLGLVEYYCLDVVGTCLVSGGLGAALLMLLFGWLFRVLSGRQGRDVKAKVE